MPITDDHGVTLDAEFSAVPDDGRLAIVLESMSGRADARAPRNTDYRPALEVLLHRLKDLDAVIYAAVVDSRITRRLPETHRSLLDGPLWLGAVSNVAALRRQLTNAQTTVGQAPGARRPGKGPPMRAVDNRAYVNRAD